MYDKPERRRIALFSTSFLPYSQTFIHDEIRTHSDQYEIEVFCKDRQNEDRFPWDNYHKPSGKLAEIIYQNIAYWPSFKKRIGNGNFDLIHAHFGTGSVYTLPYVKKFNLPLVVTFHGYDVASMMGSNVLRPDRWRYALKFPRILQEASLMLAASEELKSLLIELGADPEKVKVYRLGIDLEKFEYHEPTTDSDEVRFIMVGRFTDKKGHKYALKALKKVLDDGYKASLSFIGSGELQSELEEYTGENNLESNVHFLGVMSPEEVSDELQKSDVLVAPSVVTFDHDRESGLIVVKEASATGRPVIGTWHGGIHEIIDDGETGYLVPERNAAEIADRMIKLIENPELRKAFGKAGRKKMEDEYDLKKQVQILESHYESIIEGSK